MFTIHENLPALIEADSAAETDCEVSASHILFVLSLGLVPVEFKHDLPEAADNTQFAIVALISVGAFATNCPLTIVNTPKAKASNDQPNAPKLALNFLLIKPSQIRYTATVKKASVDNG